MAEHIRTVSREFATGPKAVVHLESRSGTVIVESRDIERVTVEATIKLWSDITADADDAAALVERNMEQDGHRVIIRAPSIERTEGWALIFRRNSPGVDYLVRVPRTTAVRVLSRSGSVVIRGVEGTVHSEALSGKITIEEITGNVNVVARSGSVQVERVAGAIAAEARSGKLRVKDIDGPVQAEARSGSIEIDGVSGDLRVIASSGGMTIERPGGKVYARARAGSIRFRGRVCDDIDIEAHAGSITFGVDPAFPFFLDAESRIGSVSSDLKHRKGAAPPAAGGPRVRLRTHAGSIRLVES